MFKTDDARWYYDCSKGFNLTHFNRHKHFLTTEEADASIKRAQNFNIIAPDVIAALAAASGSTSLLQIIQKPELPPTTPSSVSSFFVKWIPRFRVGGAIAAAGLSVLMKHNSAVYLNPVFIKQSVYHRIAAGQYQTLEPKYTELQRKFLEEDIPIPQLRAQLTELEDERIKLNDEYKGFPRPGHIYEKAKTLSQTNPPSERHPNETPEMFLVRWTNAQRQKEETLANTMAENRLVNLAKIKNNNEKT